MQSLILIALMLVPTFCWAELTIFDVRKTLAMSDTDKIYRDFYINGGSEAGLSAGMVITVQRRMPLYDNYMNRSAGDLDLKVAKIKIIHVQKGLAVARLHSEFTRENAPILEDNFIMVGDRLDIGSAESDGKKAEEPARATEPVASVSTAPKIVVNTVEIKTPEQNPPLPLPSADQPTLQ